MSPDRKFMQGLPFMMFREGPFMSQATAFPHMKAFQQQIAERFEARTEAQKGITSPDGDFGD
jgi:hypothetical protein